MNVIWLSAKEGTPARGYWDQRLLEELLKDEKHIVWDYTDDGYHKYNLYPDIKNPIVIIPCAYQAEYLDEINSFINSYDKCTVIITSDEENNFPIDKLKHPNMRVFANYYNPKYESEITWLPIGPANVFKNPLSYKTKNFTFIGQVTHPAREKYIAELRRRDDGLLIETKGFAQGKSPEDYFTLLAEAKVVPSPAGNISPDAFRTYEAICAGAVPIPTGPKWHDATFGKVPFPVIDNFEQVNGYIDDAVSNYPTLNNKVQAWWLEYKRKIKNMILGGGESPVTVMIPCSPIKSHPSIEIIDHTIKTIRHHLPDAEIIVTFDGVREEQKESINNYEEFKRRFLWECYNNPLYKNILPLIFEEHMHQVKLARAALDYVNSDKVLYIEQDAPLTPDVGIEWQKCFDFIDSGDANVIRFHFEATIPDAHKHLMIGKVEDGFLKTFQWSQRPHLISVPYFERILQTNFSPDAICFIEDKMHGIIQDDVKRHGLAGWNQHRIWIYHPEGNIKRSYHLDGRAGAEKWDGSQKW